MIKVFTPGYFAREDTRTPMIFAGVSVAVNVALALTLFPRHRRGGHRHGGIGVRLAQRGAASLHAAAARAFLASTPRSCRTLPRLVLCCAVMGAAVYGGTLGCSRPISRRRRRRSAQVGALLLLIGAGGLVYFAAAQLTGAVGSARALLRSLRRTPPPRRRELAPRRRRFRDKRAALPSALTPGIRSRSSHR